MEPRTRTWEIREIPLKPMIRMAVLFALALSLISNVMLGCVFLLMSGGAASIFQGLGIPGISPSDVNSGLGAILTFGFIGTMMNIIIFIVLVVIITGLYNFFSSIFWGVPVKLQEKCGANAISEVETTENSSDTL
jgi:hypothetical protein